MDEPELETATRTELKALEHRLEYLQAMARQLRTTADGILESRTWRILTGLGRVWLKGTRKLGAKPASCSGITDETYWRWLAESDRREASVCDEGPRFGLVSNEEHTLASASAQTYKKWTVGEDGDYLIFPEAGDELGPDALGLFAQAARQGADLIYCDEDVLDDRGLRVKPWFKPDWSPDLMVAKDYIGRAAAISRTLLGGSVEDVCERATQIVHVPKVLYHRRGAGMAMPRRVRYPVPPGTAVEIVVPSRNAELLAQCLSALRGNTAYTEYRIAVIDNSQGNEVRHVAERYSARVVDWRGQVFNYSAMNNLAAATTAATVLLFLNDDAEPRDAGWLEAMLEHAMRPEVGTVGARLLYPDGRIQHAGVVIGIFGVCGHAFKGCPGDRPTYGGLAETVRNVSAVTGACLMIRTELFRAIDGFDATCFPVAYNDIDLCLRIGESGKRVIYTPFATLYHHEAYSKPRSQRDPASAEIRAFQSRWRKYIEHDPYYNPNLTRANETYTL